MTGYVNINNNEKKRDIDKAGEAQSGVSQDLSEANIIGSVNLRFDRELVEKLKALCQREKTSLFLTLIAGFQALLYRHNITEDIGVHDVTGDRCLTYTTRLSADIDGNTSFVALLQYMKVDTTAGSKLVCQTNQGECCERSDTSERITFIMQHENANDIVLPELFAEGHELSVVISEEQNLAGAIRYRNGIYSDDEINKLAARYTQLLHTVAGCASLPIGSLNILTAEEYRQLIYEFNDTADDGDKPNSVVDLFETQVEKTPDNIAVFNGDESTTYAQLNNKANQLARHLIAIGVKPNDNVALLVTRQEDMIIGMYAILKTGAAYVPVTPDTPKDRKLYVLNQSGVKFVVSNIDSDLTEATTGVESVDMRAVLYTDYKTDNPGLVIDGRQLAYTIYTSGSTGVPKGVMIEHHSVVNLVNWVNAEFNVNASDRLLFVTSIGFDLSVYDVFGMLATGGAIVIAQKEDIPNAAKVAELLKKYEVTFWDSVPSTMEFLVNRLAANDKDYRQTSLRLVFLSGDWIPVNLPGKIRQYFPNAKAISLGGATEGTIWSNYYPVDEVKLEWRSIPYGKPIANNSFYILNDQLQPVPPGVTGELYIGGVGVARGYANDVEKTARLFVTDPFTAQWGGRMYRTGDLGRMLPGNIMEFVGRKDSQVKIRGHRVELGEVESVIRQCESVANICVLLSPDRQQLISYVVPGMYYDRDAVLAFVRDKLPVYMVPGKWLEIENIPLTLNGKTDTKALQNLDDDGQPRREFVAARNETEQIITKVWQEILNVDSVGIYDNFFDLGGQSLLAVELITQMEKHINKKLPVNILYQRPTIAEISDYLQKDAEEKQWRSLLAVKANGTKMPIYIVHGDGLSLSNFQNLAAHVHEDQPVYSLQPIGLNGKEDPLDNIVEIAKHYITEIIEHNPAGPYALGGYSFGGYVAIEMRKQLDQMGKQVKMVAIFDTDAENVHYKKDWKTALPRRIKKQVPKFIFIAKSMLTRPLITLKYQLNLFSRKINELSISLGIKNKPELQGVSKQIEKINETHYKAFQKYHLTPFNGKVHLFRAKYRLYFVDDFAYLGWGNYAQAGVEVHDVPGDHSTIFKEPNVTDLGKALQHALDNC